MCPEWLVCGFVFFGRAHDGLLQERFPVTIVGQRDRKYRELAGHFIFNLQPSRRLDTQHRERKRREITQLALRLFVERGQCLWQGLGDLWSALASSEWYLFQ